MITSSSLTKTQIIGRGSGQKFGPTRNVDIILLIIVAVKLFPNERQRMAFVHWLYLQDIFVVPYQIKRGL